MCGLVATAIVFRDWPGMTGLARAAMTVIGAVAGATLAVIRWWCSVMVVSAWTAMGLRDELTAGKASARLGGVEEAGSGRLSESPDRSVAADCGRRR